MAPKRRLSTDEKVAHLIQSANKLKNKSVVDKIVAALKENPGIVASVVDHLADLGFKLEDAASAEATSTPPAKRRLSSPNASGSSGAAAPSLDDAGSAASMSDEVPPNKAAETQSPLKLLDVIPGKYDTISSLPPDYIRHILAVLEPISMGHHTLKGIAGARKKTISKPPLLCLLELTTDVAPDQVIKPWMRNLEHLTEQLMQAYVRKGRVAKELQMPPDYSKFGVYAMRRKQNGGGIFIKHRATGVEKELSAKARQNFKDPDSMHIEKNWSTKYACLCEQGSLAAFLLMPLFTDDIISLDLSHSPLEDPSLPAASLPEAPQGGAVGVLANAGGSSEPIAPPKNEENQEEEHEQGDDEKKDDDELTFQPPLEELD